MILSFNQFINESKLNDPKYSCHLWSDRIRMELIDTAKSNPDEPVLDKLIDTYNGYDDQVYIQTVPDGLIYYEGWVNACWDALYKKPEYKGLSKEDAISKFINTRFINIAKECNCVIKNHTTFLHKKKYIMKIELKK